jgi:putative oxidoreductase
MVLADVTYGENNMQKLVELYYSIHNALFQRLKYVDGLAPLVLRLYLVPVFWVAGTTKLAGMENTIAWFGNPDWGLGLPFPALMAYLAAYTEVIGAILLALGLATRWISIPLMVTMVVAVTAVHWDNGWAAIADSNVQEVAVRLERAREILQENSDYDWLTAKGGIVILNNGIEFAVTYLVMLLALFFGGGGRFVSVDYWFAQWSRTQERIAR